MLSCIKASSNPNCTNPFLPGARIADVDDVADQKKASEHTVPDDGPDTTNCTHEVAGNRDQFRNVPDTNHAKCESHQPPDRAGLR